MNQIVTKGIILGRIDYGEADRIITLLTPDQGKIRLMAKGVRRVKSKLAGGIELFSVSQITFIRGRGDIGTLVSTRLIKHYGSIVSNIERVQLGYDLLKLIDKSTEDEPDETYFHILEQAFAALDDKAVNMRIVQVWFRAQLLRLAGHEPNLHSDVHGVALQPDMHYRFVLEDMGFVVEPDGPASSRDIKCLRMFFSTHGPRTIQQVQGIAELLPAAEFVVRQSFDMYIRR